MKKKFIYVLIIVFSILLSGSYYESSVEEQLSIAEESGINNALSKGTLDMLKALGVEGIDYEKLSSLSFCDVIKLTFESFLLKIKEPFRAALTVTTAAILCAVIQSFCENFSQTGTIINTVSALTAAGVILIPLKETVSYSAKVIEDCSNFMLGFIPIYSSVITASGYISSASGFRSLMLAAATVISKIANEIIVPLILIYLAICVAGTVSEIDISSVSKTVKGFATWVLTFSMLIFSGIMGLGTLITSSADGAFAKTAKFLIGSTIPVVGSSISDALSTVRGCLTVTKNVLGTYGILVIAVIFLPPIISLLSWKICLSAASGIGGIFGNKNLSGLLSSASAVMGIMLSLTAVTAVMFIFSVSIMLMTGGTV